MNIFNNINDKDLEKLLKCLDAKNISFKKNSTIINNASNTNILSIITKGSASIIRIDYNGNKTLIENLKEKISFYGTLETLENAIKGGRINPLAGKIIGALNFKAIVQIKDGVVKPIDKARGESNSIKKVANYITSSIEDTKDKILCLMHANCPEKAHKLLSIIEKTHKFDEVYISEVGPVMGTYTSEGAVLGAVL